MLTLRVNNKDECLNRELNEELDSQMSPVHYSESEQIIITSLISTCSFNVHSGQSELPQRAFSLPRVRSFVPGKAREFVCVCVL